ncbi:DUF4395 domain-containing protein [Serinibacter arcticus]|uniref:DUF4395 domain-containing protein n=1 Tax=Serinibacter arcticus TaxID=1655435 RepID=UPI001092A560|nr:DUF4395 domain-containing protein [Serinibacter arcticus]
MSSSSPQDPSPVTAPATSTTGSPATPAGIDPRGPRFGAALTAVLLLAIIVLGDGAAGLVLGGVVVAGFALGAFGGIQRTWQGAVYRALVAPRLGPPAEREDPRPPTFAQLVGFVITATGLVLALVGVPYALVIAAALAFVAAFLNAVFDFCLGCEIYGIWARLRAGRGASPA